MPGLFGRKLYLFIIILHLVNRECLEPVSPPLLGGIVVAGILVNYLQVGFIFSADPITPKLSKLDPIKGFSRIVSKQTLVELIKNIFKIVIVGSVTYLTVKGELSHIVPLMDMEIWLINQPVMLKIHRRIWLQHFRDKLPGLKLNLTNRDAMYGTAIFSPTKIMK